MILPTKLGLSFTALAAMIYLVALQSASGLLFLVLGVMVGCALLNVIAAAYAVAVLNVTPPTILTATEGSAPNETWEIHNTGSRDVQAVELRGAWGTLFRLGFVPAGKIVYRTATLSLPRRGVYPLASQFLESRAPFGLIRCRRRLRATGEILVFPAAYPCAPPLAAGFEPVVGGRFRGSNRAATGESFHGIRPIRPEDPEKLIHWPSSAKGQGLMVREYDEELSGRVGLLLDVSAAQTDDGQPLLDWAARALASLTAAALDQTHQVEFIDLHHRVAVVVPPFADGRGLLERLARLEPRPLPLGAEEIRAAVACLSRRTSLCFVLTRVNAAALHCLETLKRVDNRQVCVYLPTSVRGAKLPPDLPVHFYGIGSIDRT